MTSGENSPKNARTATDRIEDQLDLPPNWKKDAAWIYTVLFLKRNGDAIQEDLGPVALSSVAKALAKSMRCQWNVAGKLLEDALGRLGTESLARQLARAVDDLLGDQDDEDAAAAAPIPTGPGEPSDGAAANKSLPTSPWGVSSYA